VLLMIQKCEVQLLSGGMVSLCMVGALTLRSSSPCSSADLGCPWEDTLFSECLSLPTIGKKRAEKFLLFQSPFLLCLVCPGPYPVDVGMQNLDHGKTATVHLKSGELKDWNTILHQ